ncbi:hypothetical protein, partial [Shewanella mangrovisoli]|uniref:hypothetical protein n=1 Tax=Shewanella mangrovisoli TaxID=2864211 RepID=UPI0035B764E5
VGHRQAPNILDKRAESQLNKLAFLFFFNILFLTFIRLCENYTHCLLIVLNDKAIDPSALFEPIKRAAYGCPLCLELVSKADYLASFSHCAARLAK